MWPSGGARPRVTTVTTPLASASILFLGHHAHTPQSHSGYRLFTHTCLAQGDMTILLAFPFPALPELVLGASLFG